MTHDHLSQWISEVEGIATDSTKKSAHAAELAQNITKLRKATDPESISAIGENIEDMMEQLISSQQCRRSRTHNDS